MLIQEEWAGNDEFLEAIFGDEKSKRSRLGPGVKWTKALKWESLTGHIVAGKLSWWWHTVNVPSKAF